MTIDGRPYVAEIITAQPKAGPEVVDTISLLYHQKVKKGEGPTDQRLGSGPKTTPSLTPDVEPSSRSIDKNAHEVNAKAQETPQEAHLSTKGNGGGVANMAPEVSPAMGRTDGPAGGGVEGAAGKPVTEDELFSPRLKPGELSAIRHELAEAGPNALRPVSREDGSPDAIPGKKDNPTLSDKTIETLERIADKARARRAQRQLPRSNKPGQRAGASILSNEAFDWAVEISARAAAQGFGRARG